MRSWIILLTLYLCLSDSTFIVNDELYQKIKSNATWEAEEPSANMFKGWTKKQLQNLLGYSSVKPDAQIKLQSDDMMAQMNSTFPDSFDGRKAWKGCMGKIKEQGNCGGCWAFATVDPLSVLRCIKNKSSGFQQLSIQYLISCDTQNNGCQGGNPFYAFQFLTSTGVPNATCVPYTSSGGDTGACPTKCKNKKPISMQYKCAPGSHVDYAGNLDNIKTWVSTNGPMFIGFFVYDDFYSYKSGVYYHVSNNFMGAHAVTLIGYGYEKKTKLNYFICKNSWGNSWGKNGYFFIKIGDCEIGNLDTTSCLPDN